MWDRLDDQLGYPLPHPYVDWVMPIQVRGQHHHFTAVASIDDPWRVDDGQSLAQCSPAACMHEPGITGGQADGQTSRYCDAFPRLDRAPLCGEKVQSSITRMRDFRKDGVWVQSLNQHRDVRG